jgi:Glycosyltransferase family 87
MKLTRLASPLVLSAGVAIAALVAGYQLPSPHVLNVGPPGDEKFVDGFQARQRAGGRFFRWSSAESAVDLVGVEWNTDQELTLRLASGRRPPEAGIPVVVILVNGHTVGRAVPTVEPADYRFAVSRSSLSPMGVASVTLRTATFRTRGGRRVGVVVEQVRLERAGAAAHPALPPLGTAALWIVNAWLFRALVSRTPLSRGRAAASAAYVAGALALAVAVVAARTAVSRFAWGATLTLALGYGAACLLSEWRGAAPDGRGTPLRFLHTLGVDEVGRRRWIEAAALALVAWHFAIAVVAPLRFWGPKDLSIYHDVGVLWREGRDYYDVNAMRQRFGSRADDRTVFAFTSPPSSAVFYVPLSLLSLPAATVAWRILNLTFLTLAGWAVWKAFRLSTSSPPSPVWLALGLAASEPVKITLRLGQVGLLVLLMLALSLWGLTRRRAVVTALGLVLASALKVLPGFLLVHAAYRRERRTLTAAVVTGSLFLGAVLLAEGVAPWRTWLTRVLPAVSAPVAYFGNQSVAGSLRRLAGATPAEPPVFNYTFSSTRDPRSALERLLVLAVGASALGLALWRLGPDPGRDVLRRQLEFATMIPLMLLLAPLVWEFYFAWLLLPFFAMMAWLGERPMPAREQMVLVALLGFAWILMQYDTTDTYRRPGWPVVLMSLGLLADVVILGCGLGLLGRPRDPSPARAAAA